MHNINLLVITQDYPVAIAGTKRVQHLIEPLISKGISIKVLSLRSENKIKDEKGKYRGINYERIGTDLKLKIFNLQKIIQYYIYTLYSIFKSKKKDVKNVIYLYGSINIEIFIFILFAKFIRYKLIFDIVEDYTIYPDKLKFSSKFKIWTIVKLEKLNILLSDAIIVISTFLMKKYNKLNAKNVTLITITAKTIDNSKARICFNNPFQIVYAGTFTDKDGVDLIIQGFIQFNKLESNSKLYLIGAGGTHKKIKKKYQGIENIIFTGFIPDEEYYPLIENADVLCMYRVNSAFANAGFPFKLGEYLATSNPVIATKVSDVELFLTEKDAFLIEPENIQQFVDTLIEIKNNPTKAFEIGKNGLKACKENFSPQKNSEILFDLLLKL
jgi:glycosyltransferase involved in cell wall biosynthesis